jgi:hypothetical protein
MVASVAFLQHLQVQLMLNLKYGARVVQAQDLAVVNMPQ